MLRLAGEAVCSAEAVQNRGQAFFSMMHSWEVVGFWAQSVMLWLAVFWLEDPSALLAANPAICPVLRLGLES